MSLLFDNNNLHGWLFDNVSFNPGLSRDQRERYTTAFE